MLQEQRKYGIYLSDVFYETIWNEKLNYEQLTDREWLHRMLYKDILQEQRQLPIRTIYTS